MSQIANTIITNAGLRAVNKYGGFGSHFAIRYFLPVYDPRIDSGIHTGTNSDTSSSGTDILVLSASVNANNTIDLIPGDFIYNPSSVTIQTLAGVSDKDDVYSISLDDQYVILNGNNYYNGDGYDGIPYVSAGSLGGISASSQNTYDTINFFGTSALSTVVSASSFVAYGDGSYTGTDVDYVTSANLPSFSTLVPSGSRDTLFRVAGFAPSNPVDPSDDVGKYFMRLDNNVGDFKFNKIITFVSKMNSDGTEDLTYEPLPFSVTPLTYTNEQVQGRTAWEFVLELSFKTPDDVINFSVSAANDEWTYTSAYDVLAAVNRHVSITDGTAGGHDPKDARLNVVDATNDQLRLASSDTSATETRIRSDSSGVVIVAPNNEYDLGDLSTGVYATMKVLSPNGSRIVLTSGSDNFYFGIADTDGNLPGVATSTSGITSGALVVASENNIQLVTKNDTTGANETVLSLTKDQTAGIGVTKTKSKVDIYSKDANVLALASDEAWSSNKELRVDFYGSSAIEDTGVDKYKLSGDVSSAIVAKMIGGYSNKGSSIYVEVTDEFSGQTSASLRVHSRGNTLRDNIYLTDDATKYYKYTNTSGCMFVDRTDGLGTISNITKSIIVDTSGTFYYSDHGLALGELNQVNVASPYGILSNYQVIGNSNTLYISGADVSDIGLVDDRDNVSVIGDTNILYNVRSGQVVGNQNTLKYYYTDALTGDSNYSRSGHGYIVGNLNSIDGTDFYYDEDNYITGTKIIGERNVVNSKESVTIGNQNFNYAGQSYIMGDGNTNYVYNSIAVGFSNYVGSPDLNASEKILERLALGVGSDRDKTSMAIGWNNSVGIDSYVWTWNNYNIAIGKGLVDSTDGGGATPATSWVGKHDREGSVLLGSYNAMPYDSIVTTSGSVNYSGNSISAVDTHLLVGNGNGSSDRHNVFEILTLYQQGSTGTGDGGSALVPFVTIKLPFTDVWTDGDDVTAFDEKPYSFLFRRADGFGYYDDGGDPVVYSTLIDSAEILPGTVYIDTTDDDTFGYALRVRHS